MANSNGKDYRDSLYHKISRLTHGGIMVNYQCNAACRHCLYACSPERSGGYIQPKMAEDVCGLLREGGCTSVHIGGGEPFLDINGLIMLLEACRRCGVEVEYIETNAFWAADEDQAVKYLRALAAACEDTRAVEAGSQAAGTSSSRMERPALCISLDPFHAEYVPPALPIKLAEICRQEGFGYFIWQDKYRAALSRIDNPRKAHTRAELERQLSYDYVLDTAQTYGLKFGGRAMSIEAEYGTPKPIAEILGVSRDGQFHNDTQKKPCRNLLQSGHFHVDLYGRYIPPGCTGIVISLVEAVRGVPQGKYPAFDALVTGGVAALYDLAQGLGFKAEAAYTSSCALCVGIRHWLSGQGGFPELDAEHYGAALTYTG